MKTTIETIILTVFTVAGILTGLAAVGCLGLPEVAAGPAIGLGAYFGFIVGTESIRD